MVRNFKSLKKKYDEIVIPKELDTVVQEALKKRRIKQLTAKWSAGVAAAALLFTTSVNVSPAMAQALSEVPIVGEVVKVITVKQFEEEDDLLSADIKVPAVTGLENKNLEDSLNEDYLEEGKTLYKEFEAIMELVNEGESDHYAISSDFEVKTDNEQILVLERYVSRIAGSSSTSLQYDTIDKKNEILLSLPMLFKDDSYIQVISENIKHQMLEQMKSDTDKVYWVEDAGLDNFDDFFKAIKAEQQFYINNNGKLVISFDEYEVAPGYMGTVEFIIPTEVLREVLVSNEYIH
ncbi:anti-sigma-V factor RsiV [Gracilibacillus alcaliphilus]|uniref:DUF3298 domain-containing protein n=1 Tax=Gracilibacillus alcaliphilus TaxID=1401441 RepID=UPI00195B37CE|nr:DUF3298 domain-containing protein [Gracilibacillus alcaliphilus]MBM7675639.1 hypothetical protein [Gracilibacillus alcaliphilus]